MSSKEGQAPTTCAVGGVLPPAEVEAMEDCALEDRGKSRSRCRSRRRGGLWQGISKITIVLRK